MHIVLLILYKQFINTCIWKCIDNMWKNTRQTSKQWSPPESGMGVNRKTEELYLLFYTSLIF